jgi:hypothetical protein
VKSGGRTHHHHVLRALGGRARPDARSGTGVTIAVIDWGFDLFHPSLVTPDRKSRFAALVDQNADPNCILDGTQLDAWVRHGDRAHPDAIYDPHANYYDRTNGRYGAHGTAMASIAAGTPVGREAGLAPAASLIGIQLAHTEPDWREVDANGTPTWLGWRGGPAAWNGWRSYLDNGAIASAVTKAYVIAAARGDPALVINLSIGSWAGAHDGRSMVERSIADVVAAGAAGRGPATVVVVPTGNAGALRQHYAGRATAAAPANLVWNFAADDTTSNKLEIWYGGPAPLGVALTAPEGAAVFDLTAGPTRPLVVGDALVGIAEHTIAASGPLNRIRVALAANLLPRRTTRAGETVGWSFRLSVPEAGRAADIRAWVERNDGTAHPSTLSPHTRSGTLSGIACADGALVVGGRDPDDPTYDDVSGAGPHPWTAAPLPHVFAPWRNVRCARSKTWNFTTTTGTSAATALVAGGMAAVMGHVIAETGSDPERTRAALLATIDEIRRQPASTDQLSHPAANERIVSHQGGLA